MTVSHLIFKNIMYRISYFTFIYILPFYWALIKSWNYINNVLNRYLLEYTDF